MGCVLPVLRLPTLRCDQQQPASPSCTLGRSDPRLERRRRHPGGPSQRHRRAHSRCWCGVLRWTTAPISYSPRSPGTLPFCQANSHILREGPYLGLIFQAGFPGPALHRTSHLPREDPHRSPFPLPALHLRQAFPPWLPFPPLLAGDPSLEPTGRAVLTLWRSWDPRRSENRVGVGSGTKGL